MPGMHKELITKLLTSAWDFVFNSIILKRFGFEGHKMVSIYVKFHTDLVENFSKSKMTCALKAYTKV